MPHKLFKLRLQEAQERRKKLEGQVAGSRAKMHELLLSNKHAQAEECQLVLERLQRQLELATEKVKAVEGTKPLAEREAREARKDLEETLPRLWELSKNLPEEYKNILTKKEELDALLEDFSQDYQASFDRHYEARFLTGLLEEEAELPQLFQFDPSPLAEFSHKLKAAAQIATLPNAQIRWQAKLTQLEHIEKKELKRQRRREAGYQQEPDAAFALVGY